MASDGSAELADFEPNFSEIAVCGEEACKRSFFGNVFEQPSIGEAIVEFQATIGFAGKSPIIGIFKGRFPGRTTFVQTIKRDSILAGNYKRAVGLRARPAWARGAKAKLRVGYYFVGR